MKHRAGTKGSPRAFSVKLGEVMAGPKCRLQLISYDRELELRSDIGKISPTSWKHVDDIKLSGLRRNIFGGVIPACEEVFGKLTIHENEFTNTRVRRRRQKDGSIIIDQDENLTALRPITHQKMISRDAHADADKELIPIYWSLLGALAYALITQYWLSVYVVSLRHTTKKPQNIHIRRLNAIVRVAQKRPAKITYAAMKPTGVLECPLTLAVARKKTRAME